MLEQQLGPANAIDSNRLQGLSAYHKPTLLGTAATVLMSQVATRCPHYTVLVLQCMALL